MPPPTQQQSVRKKVFVKIGRPGACCPPCHALALPRWDCGIPDTGLTPGYKIVKIRDPVTQRMGLLFTVSLPEIKAGEKPRRRFMSAFEQRREIPNRALQYVIVSLKCDSEISGRKLTPARRGAVRDDSICDPVEGARGGRRGLRVDVGALGLG